MTIAMVRLISKLKGFDDDKLSKGIVSMQKETASWTNGMRLTGEDVEKAAQELLCDCPD